MDLTNILMITMTTIITTSVAMLLKYITNLTKAAKATNDTTREAVRSVLKYNIVQAHEAGNEKGSTNRYVVATVIEMYERYKLLGGNSFVGQLVADICEMPMTDAGRKK